MAERTDVARLWWALVMLADHLRHGDRRTITDIAKTAEVAENSLRRQIRENTLPSAVRAIQIARAVGLPEEVMWAAFAERPICVDTKGFRVVTSEDSQGPRALPD